ncbi:MAG: Crp/Fnr family transcriptional regulator [Terriglobia bacterium]|jgi:CRP/FNR family cyclic AMP-dependent transcriptional regulator
MGHQRCLTLSGFIQDHLHTLQNLTTEKLYSRNEVIYFMGDSAEDIYLIHSGRVKITRVSLSGKEKIIDIYETGDFFGELCLCENSKRTDQAVALDDVKVLSFKISKLLQVISKDPGAVLELLMLFCQRLSEAQGQIETLAFDNIPRRLAKELLKMTREGGVEVANGIRVRQYLTHEELSQLVGTSREIITTVMNQFRRQGLVVYTRKTLVVSPSKTERYLEQQVL